MTLDAIGQEVKVEDFVFYHGNVYKISKTADKKVHMNYVTGHKLVKEKVKYAYEVCVIDSVAVTVWLLAQTDLSNYSS